MEGVVDDKFPVLLHYCGLQFLPLEEKYIPDMPYCIRCNIKLEHPYTVAATSCKRHIRAFIIPLLVFAYYKRGAFLQRGFER